MTVVTGAAGFIGQHLVRYLAQRTSGRVIGLDNLRRRRWNRVRDCAPANQVERMRTRLGLEPQADPLAALWMPQTRWLRSQPRN